MANEKVGSNARASGLESGFEASSNAIPTNTESQSGSQSEPRIIPITSRQTSDVWPHFIKLQIGQDIKVECKLCSKRLAGGRNAGTSHLKDHIAKCPKRLCLDLKQTKLFGAPNLGNSSETLSLAPYEFRQEDGRRDVAEMIILHEYPLCMVEHYGFRKLCKTLQPGFKVPCRNTTRKDIMKRYDIQKENMVELLSKTKSKIALTTDMWTSSNQRKGYMAVTAHFIDNAWKLQSRILRYFSDSQKSSGDIVFLFILRFVYVEAPHTKEALADALCQCIYDWNLDCRISSITLDNCSTNDAMMDILRLKLPKNTLILREKFLHMRCCAHILNLIVQDGMNIISEGIERVRNSVVFWTASVLRKTKFENTAKANDKSCSKKLVLDCKTSWNSTYEMLKVAIMYKKVFDILSGRESDIYKCAPLQEDWETVEKICEKLELFSDVTHDFSATKYPTSNIYFSNICEIRIKLNEWITSSDPLIRNMATEMLEKYNKYWRDANTLLAVAAILDPRYKLPILRYYYQRFYEDYEVEFEVDKVKSVLRDLVTEYSATYIKGKGKMCGSMSSQSGKVTGKRKLSDFAKFLEVEVNQVEEKSELDKYLETSNVPIIDSDFDILGWWKANGSTFPILQAIARDILSIPVSSVASESAFSTGGRVLSAHRSRLLPSTVEALMCAQNWIWSNIKGGGELKEVEYQQIIDGLEEEECTSTTVDDQIIVD